MKTTKLVEKKPYFKKEKGVFVLYKPNAQVVGRYKTWQDAQLESLKHFGRRAVKTAIEEN